MSNYTAIFNKDELSQLQSVRDYLPFHWTVSGNTVSLSKLFMENREPGRSSIPPTFLDGKTLPWAEGIGA